MATAESLQRWRGALMDLEQIGTMPSGQQLREQFDIPQLAPGTAMHRWMSNFMLQALSIPFRDLWSTDHPDDPALLAVLQPVHDAIAARVPDGSLRAYWDRLTVESRTALTRLEAEPMSEPTVEELITDIFFALKTTLLIAAVGEQGFSQLSSKELIDSVKGAVVGSLVHAVQGAQPPPLPRRYFDLSTSKFVGDPSSTTLTLAGFKYFANRDISLKGPNPDIQSLPKTLPAVAKQFASQAIVNFYTDWEERFRNELAAAHGCDERDFQVDYFGDLNRMRQDYVHRAGISGQSDGCKLLKWFKTGDLMIPTPLNYGQLLTDFPIDELRQKPAQRKTGRDRLKVQADLALIREFDRVAGLFGGSKGAALDEALGDWITKQQDGKVYQ